MERKLFGTDGIRGIANIYPMTAEIALKLGQAVAKVLINEKKSSPKVIIGKDTRVSGYIFENALTAGLCSMGVLVYLVGPMPTPAIAHLTKSFAADAGIVISASHNPAADNGIKVFSADGFKLPDNVEQKIEQIILSNNISTEHIIGDKVGKAYRIEDARGRYIEFAKGTINNLSLKGLKIVLDCAHGAAYKVAPLIFKELGAEVIIINNTPNGLNINDNAGAMHPELLKKYVLENKAALGIALDGDADRVILMDEAGNIINGDYILAIIALFLKEKKQLSKNTVVATVMSNLGLIQLCKENKIQFVQVKVGDRYVIEEMQNSGAIIGGEQSGHIILSEYTTTGDGTIAALQVLRIMKEKKKKLSELASVLKEYPQVIINVEVKQKTPLEKLPAVSKKIKEVENKLADNGRVLVRYSGTQNCCRIMVEGQDKKEITNYADQIAAELKKASN
ncbi:phosphoglucosamine mutase [Candidatus Woesearchaeota archaeon]|nr:phosphoglucosamine mutase [Candidatus Woesearchaeota archaeon]